MTLFLILQVCVLWLGVCYFAYKIDSRMKRIENFMYGKTDTPGVSRLKAVK